MLLLLCGCVVSHAPLLPEGEGDEPLPGHFIVRPVDCAAADEGCKRGLEVTSRDHGYAFWEVKHVDGRWVPVLWRVHLRRLRDAVYVLQLSCQPVGTGTKCEQGYLYALLRVDSAEQISLGTIALKDDDARWGTLEGPGAGERNLTVADWPHLIALMGAHLDGGQSIDWTSLIVVPLTDPAAAAGRDGGRSFTATARPGLPAGG